MSYRRKKGGWFPYPEHERKTPRGLWHRLLWKLGFDPLSDRRRATQLRIENADWKRWCEEAEVLAEQRAVRIRKLETEKGRYE